jgi:hypothetical protein
MRDASKMPPSEASEDRDNHRRCNADNAPCEYPARRAASGFPPMAYMRRPCLVSDRKQLDGDRHDGHDNHDHRHLTEQAEHRRHCAFGHVATWQHHVFGDRTAVAVGHRRALNHKQAGERGQHVGNFQNNDQKSVEQTDQRTNQPTSAQSHRWCRSRTRRTAKPPGRWPVKRWSQRRGRNRRPTAISILRWR